MRNSVFFFVFVSPSMVMAQTTVEQLVERAVAEHPKVAAARAALRAETAGRSELGAPFRPMLSANGFATTANGTMVAASTVEPLNFAMLPPEGAVMGNLTLMWKVWTGGRDRTAKDLGDARVRAAEEMLSTVRQDVALAVRLAAAEHFFQLGRVEAARTDLEAAKETERVTSEMESVGRAPRAYVLRATAATKRAEQDLAMAEAGLKAAKAMLNEAVGGESGEVSRAADTREMPDSLAEALKSGAERSELKFMLAMAESMGLEAESVRRSLSPEVSLMAMGTTTAVSGRTMNEGMVGLVFSVPLSDGGMRSARSAMMRARSEEAMAQAEEMRLMVRREIEEAWAEWAAADAVSSAAEAELAAARESFEVERLRFENGRSTIAELLDAQAALQMARLSVVESLRYADRSRARLLRATGS
jgi:outer membrane protein TolC